MKHLERLVVGLLVYMVVLCCAAVAKGVWDHPWVSAMIAVCLLTAYLVGWTAIESRS